ncbi:Dephospho-CoA kinase [Nitrospira japonica]|uniref:Dephospho-CoA kinase n=1 Tax=Nitrospira japonica TaxID=1325564 RepID=A0A1W1I5K5_9BACT|nr:dephospho-CoA kinase [Nitrospira japonica]SLM48297.1 Dephospho-CoA kinase [Nitrospira japonica]
MILVGLTGGVATGKSTVARMFEQCGAVVISADVLAREVVRPRASAWREIVAEFGRSILKSDHTIDRKGLGDIVFRNPRKRRKLERIVHPRVARLQASMTRQAAKHNRHAVVVYEVPLLFEAGVDRRVDRIVVVTAPRSTQIARLKTRDGLPRSESLRRIDSQFSMDRKVARADAVLNGAAPLPALRAQVRKLYRQLLGLA